MTPMTTRHPFHDLLPRQAVPLRRRALKLTGNEHRAEDLVQATFLKAWASRDTFRPETNLTAWLFTILRNTFYSELRKYRHEVEDVDGGYARALSEEPRQDHALALNELVKAITLLPRPQRRPLVLMGAYGYSQLEAADACDCTLGTIKSRVGRGRATLARIIAQDTGVRSSPIPRAEVTSRPPGLHEIMRRPEEEVHDMAARETEFAPSPTHGGGACTFDERSRGRRDPAHTDPYTRTYNRNDQIEAPNVSEHASETNLKG